ASKMFGAATKVRNPVGTETVTSYLNDGRVNNSKINGNIAVIRSYDSKNQLTKLTRGGYNGDDPTAYHQYYNFAYDAFGNTTAISVGNASTSTYNLGTYTYAPKDGLLTQMTYGNGATVSYTYDNYGRKIQTDTSSHDQYKYAYTGDGQLYEMKDVSGSLLYRYTYDTLGRLIGSSLKSGSTVALQTQHQYDEANLLSKQVWTLPGKTYQEGYIYEKNNGRLSEKRITLPTSESANISLTYDNLSRISTVTTPAATSTFAYAGAFYGGGTTGLVSEITTNSVHTGGSVFAPLHLCYTYDALGNIRTEKKGNSNGSIAETLTYTYDNQSQLTKAVSSVNGTWNYQYDTYGNIRHQDHGSDSINYTYGDTNWLDLLTAISGTKNGISFSGAYSYDGAGNPTSFYNVGDLSTWTMTWKNGRELATASNGTHSVSYDYDVNGLRTYKIVDGIRHDYTYASGQLLRESYTLGDISYTLDFLYDHSGRPYILYLTTVSSSGTSTVPYYYILNLQGDVLHLVNTSGVAVASYTYDPYGNILNLSGNLAKINPLRYRGYYYDSETGFYYLQSRYYDPAITRFISSDTYTSTGQGFLGYNMFAYCENRPTIGYDPDGEFLFTAIIIGVAVGAAVSGGAKVISNGIEGKNWSDGLGVALLTGAASGALSATPVGTVGSIIGNALISMAGNATEQVIKNDGFNNFDVGDMLLDGAVGAISGAAGGSGFEKSVNIKSLEKNLGRKIFTKKIFRSSGRIVAKKAVTYFSSQTKTLFKRYLIKPIFKSGIAGLAATTAKNRIF
ncbi:MAG: RHS repeat-associated core domain-containing protein, partial [Oscillospiraceae bacterium]|nr:RHS repeat-associated core domain-containing protein [Oscillospiraceae bacterium]MBR6861723.1 RHS repeat-associated core domain-containing protein [Acidaminococcaceae bacterium]